MLCIKTDLEKIVKNTAIRNAIIYSIGALFLRGISLYMLPIYTRLLTKVDYGMLDLLTTITAVLSPVFCGGLPQVVFIYYFHTEGIEREKMIKQSIYTFFLYSTPILFITVLVSPFIASRISSPETPVTAFPLLFMAIMPAFMGFAAQITYTILMNGQKALFVSTMQIVTGLLMAILNIYGVVYLRMGYLAVIGSTFIVTLIETLFCIYLGLKYRRSSDFSFDYEKAKEYLMIGLPIVFGALANWILISADRWFLAYFRTMEELGLYAVSYKFGFVFQQLLIVPFMSAISPRLMSKFKDSLVDAVKYKSKIFLFYSILGILAIVFFILILPFVYKIFVGKEFQSSIEFTLWILFGFLFWGAAQLRTLYLIYLKKTKLVIFITFIAAISNLIACFILIPDYGPKGAAWATGIAYFVFMLVGMIYERIELNKTL
ncbi:MAG: oligosaccharide flippase family protein [Candidatus Coatesbacteria bacterium]|nr:oligosaccharide flippase family protein [Candidatus Coatesbacteria bacterium]